MSNNKSNISLVQNHWGRIGVKEFLGWSLDRSVSKNCKIYVQLRESVK